MSNSKSRRRTPKAETTNEVMDPADAMSEGQVAEASTHIEEAPAATKPRIQPTDIFVIVPQGEGKPARRKRFWSLRKARAFFDQFANVDGVTVEGIDPATFLGQAA